MTMNWYKGRRRSSRDLLIIMKYRSRTLLLLFCKKRDSSHVEWLHCIGTAYIGMIDQIGYSTDRRRYGLFWESELVASTQVGGRITINKISSETKKKPPASTTTLETTIVASALLMRHHPLLILRILCYLYYDWIVWNIWIQRGLVIIWLAIVHQRW